MSFAMVSFDRLHTISY